MVYRALVDATIVAAIIGKRGDAAALAHEADRLRQDFNQSLWNNGEGAYDGALFGPGSEVRPQMGKPFAEKIVDGRFHPTAQANLFAVYSGVVPPERLASVRKWILNHLGEVRGPMSYYYLFRMIYAMDDAGQEQQALKLMKAAWKNQLDSEWQTTWEELEDGGGSKIHIYGLHPGYFLTAYVLGARREGPVEDRKILIEPRFSGLAWAKGVCVTEFGPVEMDWKLDADGRPEIVCTIPPKAQAKLRLRDQPGSSVLEINGRKTSVPPAKGWLETTLQPGRNTVRLLAAH